MMNIDFHSEAVWQGLALHRYHIHIEEVKRVLTPVLEEVYRVGYDRGVADNYNSTENHHKTKRLCDVTAEELKELTAETMMKIDPDNFKSVDEHYYELPGSA